jgi:anti-anti-sigma factor
MAIRIRWERDILVAVIEGNIDELEGHDFSATLRQVLAQKPAHAVLDCRGMTHVASHGIALLIRFAQEMRRHGGQVRMIGVRPHVQAVLMTINLGRIVPMDVDLDAAAKNFGL